MSEKIFWESCRNTFCVFSGFCVKIVSRKGAKGAELYVLLFLCQKSLHTEITENHRILLCMSLRKTALSA